MTCDYCGLPLAPEARHELCDVEASMAPLLAPLHSCPDSGTYPCESCNPVEVSA